MSGVLTRRGRWVGLARADGFTLLEVMVAMAILALGLTTVLSSQTGLFATTRRVQNETIAASLVRCKMSELELELLENGYPLIDQQDSGECCEDEDNEFSCEWTVETVELPNPPEFSPDELGDGDDEVDDPVADVASGDLQQALPLSDDSLGDVGSVDSLASGLAPTGGDESGGGMIGMALGMVYPSLKPMLEASIRKVTVKVLWNEGAKERSFDVVQYVTNPVEGSLNPNAAEGVQALIDSGIIDGGALGGTGLGATGDGDDADAEAAP